LGPDYNWGICGSYSQQKKVNNNLEQKLHRLIKNEGPHAFDIQNVKPNLKYFDFWSVNMAKVNFSGPKVNFTNFGNF